VQGLMLPQHIQDVALRLCLLNNAQIGVSTPPNFDYFFHKWKTSTA
jgi:hypothetical protein